MPPVSPRGERKGRAAKVSYALGEDAWLHHAGHDWLKVSTPAHSFAHLIACSPLQTPPSRTPASHVTQRRSGLCGNPQASFSLLLYFFISPSLDIYMLCCYISCISFTFLCFVLIFSRSNIYSIFQFFHSIFISLCASPFFVLLS